MTIALTTHNSIVTSKSVDKGKFSLLLRVASICANAKSADVFILSNNFHLLNKN